MVDDKNINAPESKLDPNCSTSKDNEAAHSKIDGNLNWTPEEELRGMPSAGAGSRVIGSEAGKSSKLGANQTLNLDQNKGQKLVPHSVQLSNTNKAKVTNMSNVQVSITSHGEKSKTSTLDPSRAKSSKDKIASRLGHGKDESRRDASKGSRLDPSKATKSEASITKNENKPRDERSDYSQALTAPGNDDGKDRVRERSNQDQKSAQSQKTDSKNWEMVHGTAATSGGSSIPSMTTKGTIFNQAAGDNEGEEAVIVDVQEEQDDDTCFKIGAVVSVIVAFVLGIIMEHYLKFFTLLVEGDKEKEEKEELPNSKPESESENSRLLK